MYDIRILDPAIDELSKLDKNVRARVVKRIHWTVKNLDNIKLEPLTGTLKGFFKIRVGDYRIIYEILHQEKTIIIHMIGHRKEIYRTR